MGTTNRSSGNVRRYFKRRATLLSFRAVQKAEQDVIRARRKSAGIPLDDTVANETVGVCLSGGGVRSATFNLGVLQAMHQYGFLRMVDYLSTVSGGGYIGSSLSWFLFRQGKFPFPRYPQSDRAARPGEWLKSHASYLVPGDGLNIWALVAAVARGIFINLLIFIPLMFGFVFYASWRPDFYSDYVCNDTCLPPVFLLSLIYAAAATIALAIAFILYAFWSRGRPIPFFKHRRYSVQYGRHVKLIFVALAIGIVPVLDTWFGQLEIDNRELVALISSLVGSVSIVLGWFGRKSAGDARGFRAFAIGFGLAILIYGLFLWFFQFSNDLWNGPGVNFFGFELSIHVVIVTAIVLSAVLGVSADINHVSMHRFYRDRLLEAYMPDRFASHRQRWSSDSFKMKNVQPELTGGPIHIVNTNVTLLDSENPRYRIRGGDSFVFTPIHCGSKATGGWVPVADYINGKVTLATAMSISGAAVDPNTGATRSRPLAFIMSFLNVRLGYWIPNPHYAAAKNAQGAPWLWHYYALREMLGWRLDERQWYIHLSDGGHFENLGLYELIRRKCRFIVVCDAGADPKWKFRDLARAVERIRADHRAEIDINTKPLHPDPDTKYSASPYVVGTIRYDDDSEGKLIYLKTAICPDLPEDIYGYKRDNAQFPDEPTSDQFFGDQQFEAYRELGYRIAEKVFKGRDMSDLPAVFTESATQAKEGPRRHRSAGNAQCMETDNGQ